MSWLLVVIIAVIGLFILQLTHLRHRITFILVLILFLFLYISFSTVAKNHGADLSTAQGIFQATRVYFSWFGQIFTNMKGITGSVIGMEWLPENKTIQDMDPRTVMKG